ncbi:MAG: ribosomal-protein-alanine N-acetyltransferase [Crocinitomicaceae bacterium]|jgi:ribosomal-protein-alanine N-acetyltransferase
MEETASILTVREIEFKDIELIADYWLKSDPDFLVMMGVDLSEVPSREQITEMLTAQIDTPLAKKSSYALIWELNREQIGHTNVNNIAYGVEATLHLHLWNSDNRQRGMGADLVQKSIPVFFENLKLGKLICEPYSLNAAPNKTLEKVGFEFIKKYTTKPGTLNFEQEVNRWEMTL